MRDDFNPQDAFAQLVEDVRLNRVERAVFRKGRRVMVPCDISDVELNVPVFYTGGEGTFIEGDLLNEALDATLSDEFVLPFPNFCLMISVPPGHPTLLLAGTQQRFRHTYLLLAQSMDDGVELISFYRHGDFKRWARQVFDIKVRLAGEASETIAMPWLGHGFSPTSLATFQQSIIDRVNYWMTVVIRLGRHTGQVSPVEGSKIAAGIQRRRAAMHLHDVPIVRAITFDTPVGSATRGTGAGSPRAPHQRRGTWVKEYTRRSGTVVPAHARRATSVRGGTVPPWYELRGS